MANLNKIIDIIFNHVKKYDFELSMQLDRTNYDISNMDVFTANHVETIKSRYKANKVEFDGFDKILDNVDRFFEIQDLRAEFVNAYNGREEARKDNIQKVLNIIKPMLFTELDDLINLYKSDIQNEAAIGISQETQDMLWANTRDKIIKDSNSAQDNIKNIYGNRGFTMPNGIMFKANIDILNIRLNSIAESARTINISAKESRIQWKMFAMQNIVEIKNMQIGNISRFVEINLSGEGVSSGYATQYVNSYRSLYDSMNTLTNSVATINKLKLDKATSLDQQENQLWNNAVSNWVSNNGIRVGNRAGIANTMGAQTSAALSGINAMVAQVTDINE